MKEITNVELFEALRSVSTGHGKRGHGCHGSQESKAHGHHGKCGVHHGNQEGEAHGHHGKCGGHHGETDGHEHGENSCKHRHGQEATGKGRCNRARQGSRERILINLLELPYGVKQKDLVELLGIKPASISEQIDILEANGHVNKITDENDKRATVISLTDQGVEKAKESLVEREEKLNHLFSNLSDEEKEQLFALLNKLNDK